MKKRFYIVALSLLSTVLHKSFTTAFHVEPILSPFTEFLYSFDSGLGSFMRNICHCSEVSSCHCSLYIGSVNVRAQIGLKTMTENATQPINVLEIVVFVGNYKFYEEKTKVKELEEKCSVFEDKDSYVVNKKYCIKFKLEENRERTKVCANLVIKERIPLTDEEILCVQLI